MRFIISVLFLFLFIDAFAARSKDNQPVFIEADEMEYNDDTRIVTAKGNVEATQGGRVLMADQLTLDQNTNIVYAFGNVSLLEPDGNVYFAEEAELKDDLKDGIIKNFKARFKDNSLLASNSAMRQGAETIELKKAVYSPCKICKSEPEKAPFWQMKADTAIIDEKGERVYYKHGRMEFYGVPMLYTPYISHPTPGAKRKSGFLTPTYRTVNQLGTTVEVPYYINISSKMDATISPLFTTLEGVVMKGEFRHMPDNGYYYVSGSITNPRKTSDVIGRKVNNLRGHIDTAGVFKLNDWDLGFNIRRASDKTYLRRYKLSEDDTLTSRIFAENIYYRDYLSAELLSFQGLNDRDDSESTPIITPLTRIYIESRPGAAGDHWVLDNNLMILSREKGIQSRRISNQLEYRYPYITSTGHIFNASLGLRTDGYLVENVPNPIAPTNKSREFTGATGRIIPELQLGWGYPLINQIENYRIIIEPVTTAIISPYGGNPFKIPNEDSQSLELSDVNLFDNQRYTGHDRVESGPRINYGLRNGIYGSEFGSLHILLGQNYRAKPEKGASTTGGLSKRFSDYAGGIYLSDDKIIDAYYRFRLGQKDLVLKRTEIGAAFTLKPLTLNVDYTALAREVTPENLSGRKEINVSGTYNISEEWKLIGNARRNLSRIGGGLISTGTGLGYSNDCFQITTLFNRDYTRVRDLRPNTSLILKVAFKNLTY